MTLAKLIKSADSHAQMFYPWSCYFTEEKKHIRHLLATVRPRIFAQHFFTIEDVSLVEKQNHETKTRKLQLSKVSFIAREDFFLFSILYNESITILLVSLVH